MRFIKIGDSYLNMERIDIIRHCSGNVIEAVMMDGKRIYGSKKDLEGMEIVEKIDRNTAGMVIE